MADKKNFNKRRNSRSKNRGNCFIPKQVDRIDKELLQEVSVLLSINPNIENNTLKKLYKITDIQADYIRKHRQNWEILDKITKNGRE